MNRTGALSVSLLVVACAFAGCATSTTYVLTDGGAKDAASPLDGGKDTSQPPTDAQKSETFIPPVVDASNCQGTGLSGCTPQDVCSFSPTAPPPPATAVGACTPSDVTNFYDWCISPGDSTQCTALQNSKPACLACLITPDTAAQYGALISDVNNLIKNNIAGCFSVKGNGKCEGAVASNQQCQSAACPDVVCPVPSGDTQALTDLNKCLTDAEKTNCATYGQAAASCLTNPACTGSDFQSTYTLIATTICVNGN